MAKEKKGEMSVLSELKNNNSVDLKIAYIGGGSRAWAQELMRDLVVFPNFNGEIRLYDIDYEAAQFNADFGNWLQGHPDSVSKWKYRAVKTLKTALKDVDFVFLSIQPGSLEMMKSDLEEPMKYGIYQSVGDTVGPGGCIRALRSIKDYRVIAEAIAKYAPKSAKCINFTNPMTVCTRTLYKTFPDINAWGCCHEVFGTQNFLATLYAEKTGEEKPSREEINVNVLGINHFTWIDKAECRGIDLIELVKEHIAKPGVIRKYTKEEVCVDDNYFSSKKQVALELFRRFGILGAAGDRHLAEFVPWFFSSEDSCYRWAFRKTPYSYRINNFKKTTKELAKILKTKKFPKLRGSGEEYLNQMIAVTIGDTPFRTNVNLPNRGQVGNLPENAVVETNALFSKAGIEPINSGSLPAPVNSLVMRHVVNQETLIKAVFERNEDLAFSAFLSDPLCGRLALDDAWKLFKTMIKNTNFRF